MTDESKRKSKDPLEIVPLKTNASKIKNPPLCETLGIKHPFSMGIIGSSGSGKTVLCSNFLLNKQLFYRYFDKIYILSPSGSIDDSFAGLKIPKDQVVTDNFIEKLEEIIEEQKGKIENCSEDEAPDLSKAEKVLIIFEDLSAQVKLMNSKAFKIIFTQNRHLCVSVIAIVHKYKQLMRMARLNASHLMLFRCSATEIDALYTEHGTSQSKKEFYQMVEDSFAPDEFSERPFIWINNKSAPYQRFRKCLKYIYTLNNKNEIKPE